MNVRWLVLRCGVALVLLLSCTGRASADERSGVAPDADQARLQALLGTGYLGGPGPGGAAFVMGLRSRPAGHLALAFDVGYSALAAQQGVQDRWWLIPSVALVMPVGTGDAQLEAGVGLGLGASSGYASGADYAAAPFSPVWAFQMVPAARLHAGFSTRLSPGLELFARVDVAALVLEDNSLGSRVGNSNPSLTDTTWVDLLAGLRFGLL
jgi:hypothetical protein